MFQHPRRGFKLDVERLDLVQNATLRTRSFGTGVLRDSSEQKLEPDGRAGVLVPGSVTLTAVQG